VSSISRLPRTGFLEAARRAIVSSLLVVVAILSQSYTARAQFDRREPIDRLFRQFGQQVGAPQNLSNRPSIDCTRIRNSVVQIICSDKDGASADWDLNAAIWAADHLLGDAGRAAFQKEQESWRATLPQRCGLPPLFSNAIPRRDAKCVIDAFQERARSLRRTLPGDAQAEVKLSPDRRADIQRKLIALGFLNGVADGVFGPNTREAIRKYQTAHGLPGTGFLAQDTGRRESEFAPKEPNAPDRGSIEPRRPDQEQYRRDLPQNETDLKRNRGETASQPGNQVRQPAPSGYFPQTHDSAAPVHQTIPASPVTAPVTSPPQPAQVSSSATTPNSSDAGDRFLAFAMFTGLCLAIGLFAFYKKGTARDGTKLNLLSARVIAFDDEGEPLTDFKKDIEAKLSGSDLLIFSSGTGRSVRYSMSGDIRCVSILKQKEQAALGKTLTRMAFTGAAWSLTRARNRRDVGIGSALLDYRYSGAETRTMTELDILFADMSTVVLLCDEPTLNQISTQINSDVSSKRAIREAERDEGLLQRMIKDGDRGLAELKTRIEQTEASIRKLLDKAENGGTFEERDSARQEAERLVGQLAIPKAAYFQIASQS
jgi:peptidoglycan hydrolase-like protein with peptidoglycan-binding domain